ncbi:MAG: 5-deoxy-5-amino-3-dehydroquinate synthase [Acidimicrobiales bacterium]
MRTLVETVPLPDGRSYPVHVGPGVIADLASLIPPGTQRVAVVTQTGVGVTVDPGLPFEVFTVPDGEAAKRLSVVEDLARQMAQSGMTRRDLVVAVGGGVVTDLGGFLAASYHRGINVIHVATTLLGQIDAAIGGKCGVNLPEGKNLVGAFWQPAAVICDTDTLATLPAREFSSGLGELAKYQFIGGDHLAGRRLDELDLAEQVATCVRIKADVVASDEREGGRRAILNYGHTLGHALETAGAYDIRHGEGVAIGLVYAAEVARRLGRIEAASVDEHRRLVEQFGLATTVPANSDHHALVELFRKDKKATDGITFVLDGPDGVESVIVDDVDLLLDALLAVS